MPSAIQALKPCSLRASVSSSPRRSRAGVDEFLAQATPEDKLKLIRDEQAKADPRTSDLHPAHPALRRERNQEVGSLEMINASRRMTKRKTLRA